MPDVQHGAWRLARHADCDPRTARKAILRGLDAIKVHAVRDRIEQAARQLGIVLASGAAPVDEERAP